MVTALPPLTDDQFIESVHEKILGLGLHFQQPLVNTMRAILVSLTCESFG